MNDRESVEIIADKIEESIFSLQSSHPDIFKNTKFTSWTINAVVYQLIKLCDVVGLSEEYLKTYMASVWKGMFDTYH